jgi:hypothetical protein
MAGLIHCLAVRKIFKTQNRAVTAAFFIAPVWPSIFIPLVGSWRFPPDVMGALLIYVIALPLVFILGLPLFLLFSRFRIFSWWGSILGGALGGIAILALVGGRYNLHDYSLLLYGAVGAATGLAFGRWSCWDPNRVSRRPGTGWKRTGGGDRESSHLAHEGYRWSAL